MSENETIRVMEEELYTWENELERWHTDEEHADGDPQRRREQQQMLDDLHEKRLQARHYLDELARGGSWTELEPEMLRLWADIRASISMIEQWA